MTWLLAPALGALFCFAIAPFDQWWWSIVSMAGLFLLLEREPNLHPGLVTWLYGLGKFGLGASWVYVSINVYGGAPPLLAVVMVVLFVAFASLLFCFPLGWLWGKFRHANGNARALAFVGFWGFTDWLSTWFLTGFPWLFPVNGMMDVWLGGWLPVLGVLGTSLLAALVSVSLVRCFAPEVNKSTRAMFASLALLPWLAGAALQDVEWTKEQARHSVALVQGNLDQNIKWDRDQVIPNVRKHMDLSAPHWQSDVLIWPEAAITAYPQQAQRLLEDLARQANETETAFIFGIPSIEQVGDDYEFKNLAMGMGLASGRFAKHHLVPFGEYVPFESVLRGLIEFFDLPMSSSTPGKRDQANLSTHIGQMAMAICYEVAYGESMRAKSADSAVLATISNDTWFGDSLGPKQHMQLAQLRAKENGRWMLRATNNGITAIVDHRGGITAVLPQFEADTLTGEFAVMQGTTPYTDYGSWPFFVLLLLCLVPAIGGILRPS